VDHDKLANELREAGETGVPVSPLKERYPDMTVDDAYRIQLIQEQTHLAAGRVLAGRKVGLTSLAMQKQLGIDSPDFGYFFADMVHHDGDAIPVDQFIAPRVEPEFAFVLGTELAGPGVTVETAARAVARVHASLEIIDSRIVDWRIGLVDTVADNASCGAIVLGPELVGVSACELAGVGCSVSLDGVEMGTGTGADVLGNPLEALAWLANTLGERGVSIPAGSIVLPGAMTASVSVTTGSAISSTFGDATGLSVTFI
jgi:2-keto-4-pentenoate hydratase